MGKFEELNKNIVTAETREKKNALESNLSIKEKTEVESIQTEEKPFFGKVKESANYLFHIAPKKNFEKALRIVALATVLSTPIGEKAFAEREVNAKESTVATSEIDKEIDKLEQAQVSELFKQIIEQRQLLKEKYNVEIVGYNYEYTLEELQDFDEALEKVQKFAPKQFSELKIVLKKVENNPIFLFSMLTEENFCNELDNQVLNQKFDSDIFFFFKMLKMQKKIVEMQKSLQKLKNGNSNVNFYYDVIFSTDKKAVTNQEILKENTIETGYVINKVSSIDNIDKKNIYKNIYMHELCHLISLNNPNTYKELADKFNEINKKVDGSSTIIHPIHYMDNLNIKRYPGFVSVYAGVSIIKNIDTIRSDYPDKYDKENHNIYEDIAETMIYMVNEHRYANNDSLVQEKIKAIKEFLNKK